MKNKRYSKRRYSKRNSHLQLLILLILFVNIFQSRFSKNVLFNTYSKWLLVTFCFLFIVKILFLFYNKQKYLYSRIFEIDKMSGPDFEKLLKAHFEKQGYSVRLTPASNDYGADLVLIKGNLKTVVQAKRYKNKIGNKAIQEIVGAKGYYNADKCMVISNSFYTSNAIALAKANDVVLWNRNDLIDNFKIR